MEEYGVSEHSYLARAKDNIGLGTPQSMFYAAFELRCAVEARQDHYLDAQKEYAKSIPDAWKMGDQGKTLRRVYDGDKIQRLLIDFGDGAPLLLHYTPVTNRLRQFAGQLDNYRHAQTKFRPWEDDWWEKFKGRLIETYRMTWFATRGNLLSPAILNRDRTLGKMVIELQQEVEDPATVKSRIGASMVMNVTYLEEPPAEWTPDL